MKNQKGITLIALVITIIVLLILAGVSIAMLTGENGILTKATSAGDKSAQAEFEESVKLVVAEIVLNQKTGASTEKTIDKSTLTTLMANINDNVKDLDATDGTENADSYWTVTGKIGGKTCTCYIVKATSKVTSTQPE